MTQRPLLRAPTAVPVRRVDVRVLGKFAITVADEPVAGLDSRRAQELLTYLVLNRQRPIAREVLAETLWPDQPVDTRKALRQVLWQVQSALTAAGTLTLVADNGFVALHPDAEVEADVNQIEAAHQLAHAAAGHRLPTTIADALRTATSLYRGDLLQSSYAAWCIVERERVRAMYLAMLDRLMADAEAQGNVDEGLWYGEMVLRHDRASERTHRRLMVLRYVSGDRTGAMRQFESCVRALATELDVRPGPMTTELDAIIRSGEPLPDSAAPSAVTSSVDAELDESVRILQELKATLLHACDQVSSVLAVLGPSGEAARRGEDG